jgi:hypothetical protein
MGLRVCGAELQRDTISAKRCWCRGAFCGPGGFKLTAAFRRDFHKIGPVKSRAALDDLMAERDLFDGEAKREKWLARLAPTWTPPPPTAARQPRRRPPVAAKGGADAAAGS